MSVLAAQQGAQPSYTGMSHLFLKNTLLHKWTVNMALNISLNVGRKISTIYGHSVLACLFSIKAFFVF